MYVCVMEKQNFISRLRRCNFRDFFVTRAQVAAAQPTSSAQKRSSQGSSVSVESGGRGHTVACAAPVFSFSSFFPFLSSGRYLCIVYVMGLAEWLTGRPAEVACDGDGLISSLISAGNVGRGGYHPG